jgi:magnesium-transporting ATPase (P-type)
MSTTTKA